MAITVPELDKFIKDTREGKSVSRLHVGDRLFLEARRPGSAPARASFVLRYTHDGKKQSTGLGAYFPKGVRGVAGVTLADARIKAVDKLAIIDAGVQPVRAKRAAAKKETADRNAQQEFELRTVARAVSLWHEATKDKLTSDKYRAQRLRRLEEYLPLIGAKPVASLTVTDVSNAVEAIKAADRVKGRTSVKAETFRRSSADLEKSLEYAASLGWFDGVNPVTRARARLASPKQVGRRFFKLERLPEFCRAMAAQGATEAHPVTVHLLRLLALTASRTREIRLLKWSEVEGLDGSTPMLHIPLERMKKRLPWSIPLSQQAATLLRDVRAWQAQIGAGLKGVEAGFVFTRLEGNYKGRVCSENAVNDLLKAMGWADQLVGHGLRKVFSTAGHAGWPYQGANRAEAIEFSLAHVHKDKVRGIYDTNDYMTQRRALMEWWADHLDRVAADGGNVVEFKKVTTG